MASVFGNSTPQAVPFAPKAPSDEDFGPRIKFTVAELVNGKAVYSPNPELVGKALIIDVKGPGTLTDDEGKEKTYIDAARVVVVETGEEFTDQRLFQAGLVRQLLDYTGQQVIAAVGTYTSKKRAGKFVELVAPTSAQQEAANKLLAATVEPPF